MSDGFLEQYEALRPELTRLGEHLTASLRAWLDAAGLPVHFVSWRLKSVDSLARKLARPDKTYRQLWDVTDLLGVRVATSFEDHLPRVSALGAHRAQAEDRLRALGRQGPACWLPVGALRLRP